MLEGVVGFHLALERQFCSGRQADRDSWLADGAKSAGVGSVERARNQLVADFGWAACDRVQTIIAHGGAPILIFNSGAVPSPRLYLERACWQTCGRGEKSLYALAWN